MLNGTISSDLHRPLSAAINTQYKGFEISLLGKYSIVLQIWTTHNGQVLWVLHQICGENLHLNQWCYLKKDFKRSRLKNKLQVSKMETTAQRHLKILEMLAAHLKMWFWAIPYSVDATLFQKDLKHLAPRWKVIIMLLDN